jgi:hypothetical protein
MRRPRPALFRERAVVARVPVARGEDGQALLAEQFDQVVDRGDDFVPAGDAEGAAGEEIDLHVDDQEGVGLVEVDGAHVDSYAYTAHYMDVIPAEAGIHAEAPDSVISAQHGSPFSRGRR